MAASSRLGGAYWRLWSASGLSNLADGVLKVALPLVAIRLTDSPTLIAGLTVAFGLPWLFFALPAGALADRLDRRRAMLGANLLRVALCGLLALAVATDLSSIWLLYVVALCIGVAETVYDTSSQSILPLMVPRERLSRANGRLFAAELVANQFVGPPLGGFLVAVAAVVAVAAPAGLWLVAVVALLLVRGSYRVERETRSTIRADIAEGLRFLRGHRVLRTFATMVGLFNLASNATFGVIVLHLVGPGSAAGLSEPAFGTLLAMLAVGSVAGSLVAERVERLLGRRRALAVSIVVCSSICAAPALTADPWIIGAAFVAGGVANAVWNVITVSLRQRITPDRLLGRMNSVYRLVAWGTIPIGAAIGGVVGQAVGLRVVFAGSALLMLSLVAGMLVVTEAALRAAEPAPAAAEEPVTPAGR